MGFVSQKLREDSSLLYHFWGHSWGGNPKPSSKKLIFMLKLKVHLFRFFNYKILGKFFQVELSSFSGCP